MEEIRDRVASIASEIAALSERTEQIGDITATVNQLADRSNLLALNAGIEAARAGEHGRGFAVVADQVRGLAEQSKQATARIESILNEVRSATLGAVKASEAGTKVVDHGLELTEQASEGIQSLADTIRRASAAAEQIAASAEQQSVGMEQIADTMNDLEVSTSSFVEGATRSQGAAQNLDALTAGLAEATARYRVAQGGPVGWRGRRGGVRRGTRRALRGRPGEHRRENRPSAHRLSASEIRSDRSRQLQIAPSGSAH